MALTRGIPAPKRQDGTFATYVERLDPADPDADYVTTDVRVRYTLHPGYPDTWDEPGQATHCEIDVIEPRGFVLTDEEERRIGRQIIERVSNWP